jgi:hypothetical protein
VRPASLASDANTVFVHGLDKLFIPVDGGQLGEGQLDAVNDRLAVLVNITEQFLEQDIAFGLVADLASDVAGLAQFVLVLKPGRPGLPLLVIIDISGSLFWHDVRVSQK